MTIHLLCDRCRAEGRTGDDPFAAYADLLDFTPVPRSGALTAGTRNAR